LAFWAARLRNAPESSLATKVANPGVSRTTSLSTGLSLELTAALKAMSRRHAATLFMTLLAAFQTLLHLESGEVDLVVGTDVANRLLPEAEPLIGFFV